MDLLHLLPVVGEVPSHPWYVVGVHPGAGSGMVQLTSPNSGVVRGQLPLVEAPLGHMPGPPVVTLVLAGLAGGDQ